MRAILMQTFRVTLHFQPNIFISVTRRRVFLRRTNPGHVSFFKRITSTSQQVFAFTANKDPCMFQRRTFKEFVFLLLRVLRSSMRKYLTKCSLKERPNL